MSGNVLIKGAAMCIMAVAAGTALAQGRADPAPGYPSRPVTMVTPFAPGGAADVEGRVFSNALATSLGQPFVMDFKPGGTMAVGMTYAARQKPDGYTYVWVSSTYATLPLIAKDGGYDPVRDFDPVSLLNKRYSILCVTNNFPAKSLKEYVAYAKANPGAVNFGTGGAGGTQHLQGLMLELATGTQLTYVHYKSVGATYPDLIAGRAHIVPVTFGLAVPMLKAGKLRAIALSARERNPALPDVPTAIEQGINWEYSSWLGLITPAGTPAPLVNKIQGTLARIIKEPELQGKFGDEYTLLASTPAEFKRHYLAETERWKKLAADTGIELAAN